MHELERWANFYLLVAEAAATLIGLLFVIITLGADRRREDAPRIPYYLTPTVLYFASVIFLGALLTFPTHSRLTAALSICAVGGIGLAYSGAFFIRRSGKTSYYEPVDRVLYAAFPFAAYGLVVAGGILFLHDADAGLTVMACAMLSLLAVAVRNSWAIAVDVVSTHHERR